MNYRRVRDLREDADAGQAADNEIAFNALAFLESLFSSLVRAAFAFSTAQRTIFSSSLSSNFRQFAPKVLEELPEPKVL